MHRRERWASYVTSLAVGSFDDDAAMVISATKSKAMNIHRTTRTSVSTEADVANSTRWHRGTIPELTMRYVSRYLVDAQTNRLSG